MSSIVVDGLVLPVAVGGHPALDFCNTRAGWNSPAPKEYLRSYRHLVVWARHAGLIQPSSAQALLSDAHAASAPAGGVLATAIELRDAAYQLALGSPGDADWDIVGSQARAARTASTLGPDAGRAGGRADSPDDSRVASRVASPDDSRTASRTASPARPVAAWALPATRIDAPLLAIAAQLDDLFCSPLSAAVAACPGQGCGWLFADPRRRRRWCDMAVCGNRAKARRHAERALASRS